NDANVISTATAAGTRIGWAAGAGIEAALAGRWTGKLEYLHIDLGTQTLAFIDPALHPASTVTVTAALRDDIIPAGLNYPFPDAPAYASARAPAASARSPHQWTGYYAGVNIGYGVDRDPASYVFTGNNPGGENDFFKMAPSGVIGGAQIGANWQMGSWVAG